MNHSRRSVTALLLLVALLILGSVPSAAEASETASRSGDVFSTCGISTELEDVAADDLCDAVLPSRRPATWSIAIPSSDVVERRWQDYTPDSVWSPS